jgi:membrane-associated phospholipid phosphatase
MHFFRSIHFAAKNHIDASYLWLLLWPGLFLRYLLLENLNPAAYYYPIYSPLDDLIPFREEFLIPYVFWYLFIVGMHIFVLLYDPGVFRQYSIFLAVSLTISTAVFLLFPSCQNLRPETFPRDNLLTKAVGILYSLDTNTNVCPSIHVLGSFAVLFSAWNAKHLKRAPIRAAILILTLLISASTVFLKQHSIIDVAAALAVSGLAYPFVFCEMVKRKVVRFFIKWRRNKKSS